MALEYKVYIEPLAEGDGGGYLATVPDLPGCMSDGETPEEALRNVQDAIGSWLEAEKAEKFGILKAEIEKGLLTSQRGALANGITKNSCARRACRDVRRMTSSIPSWPGLSRPSTSF